MGARLVPAAFAAAAVITGAHAVDRVAHAVSQPGGRPALIAAYYLLRTVIVDALVLVAFLAAQLVRMGYEERALSRAFPEYAAYARRTPRLIPVLLLQRRGVHARTRAQAAG